MVTTNSAVRVDTVLGPSTVQFDSSPVAAYGTSNNLSTPGNYLVFSGWTVIQGGVEKYVWSADGGNTWQEVELYGLASLNEAGDTIIRSVNSDKRHDGLTHTFTADDAANGAYQGAQGIGIAANLEDYSGSTVDVIVAAVSKVDTTKLCIITIIKGVQVP